VSDYYLDVVSRLADLPLFAAASRRGDPATSHAAGVAAREFSGEHERRILEALTAGPGTKDEIAARSGLTEQQVIRRIHGLVRRGRVSDTGVTRSTASGRMATVWRKA
jgi:predicted Rossmann fold nucleotide-binding protein DprA/Smf involved in DNA uptake